MNPEAATDADWPDKTSSYRDKQQSYLLSPVEFSAFSIFFLLLFLFSVSDSDCLSMNNCGTGDMIAFSAELKYPRVPVFPALQFCSGNIKAEKTPSSVFVPLPRRFRHSAKIFRTCPWTESTELIQISRNSPSPSDQAQPKMPIEAGFCMQIAAISDFYIN